MSKVERQDKKEHRPRWSYPALTRGEQDAASTEVRILEMVESARNAVEQTNAVLAQVVPLLRSLLDEARVTSAELGRLRLTAARLDRRHKEANSRRRCKRCAWVESGQRVICTGTLGCFEVADAERIVSESPREPVTVPHRELPLIVAEPDVDVRHVDHVDRSKPGILGRVGGLRVLIEGHHRAFGQWRGGFDFRAYELTEEETARVHYVRRAAAKG